MRETILSATILAAVFCSGVAFAGQTTDKVKSIDEIAETVTLENGIVYSFDGDSDRHHMLGGYLPGDSVTIVWNMLGDKHEVRALSPDFSGAVIGKITSIDTVKETVTLDDGTVYAFVKSDEKVDVGGFKLGDEVRIVGTVESGQHMARAIESSYSTEMTGKVEAIDKVMRTVTMDSGTVVNFDEDTHALLGGFKVGDMVRVNALTAGARTWGRTISPANG